MDVPRLAPLYLKYSVMVLAKLAPSYSLRTLFYNKSRM